MYNLKRDDTNEFNYKIERLSVSENKFMVATGEGCGTGIVRGFGMDMYTLLFKMDKQQGCTVSHRELCLVLCGNIDGGLGESGYVYMYG